MQLTQRETSLLRGDYGKEAKQLTEVMFKIGELNGATEMVEVSHVMLATTIILSMAGEVGIDYVVKMADAGARFAVPTYTDVVSMDVEKWKRLNIKPDFARTQMKSVDAIARMGGVLSLTCTPYRCGAIPRLGEHVAYVETSAVIFVNSYFGARTNREVDVSALASALCGRAPYYGFHLDENRRAEVLVDLRTELKDGADYDALGNYIGKIVKTRTPVFQNMDTKVSTESLMALGAALATTGSVALFHAFGVTPEVKSAPEKYADKKYIHQEIIIGKKEMKTAYDELTTTSLKNIDFVAVGCPHCGIEKFQAIAEYLAGKKISSKVELWVCTSDAIKRLADRAGYIKKIEDSGAKVVVDTCMVAVPLRTLGFKTMATDSAKAQFYVSGYGLGIRFGSTRNCLDAAIKGQWEV